MVKKKVDPRIKYLIEKNVASGHRSLFVMIGEHGREQVVHLHYMLSKAQVAARPSVLWCYKKELGFSSHRQKRQKQLEKQRKKVISLGSAAAEAAYEKENIMERFLTTTDIRYCYYDETEKILGNTYGMLILQDFEALTPNLLARTVETVSGGGIIILLLTTLTSLKQLHGLTMDVHARFRVDRGISCDDTPYGDDDVIGRFNERFLLRLAQHPAALVLDDALNVLPWSTHARHMLKEADGSIDNGVASISDSFEFSDGNLSSFSLSLPTDLEAGAAQVAKLCRTTDQLSALLAMRKQLVEHGQSLSTTPLSSTASTTMTSASFSSTPSLGASSGTVSLTAGRGRGKSAALGLLLALALGQHGYGNIFVTSPDAANLKTLFQFVLKGLHALGFREHAHYHVHMRTDAPDTVTRIILTPPVASSNSSSSETMGSSSSSSYCRRILQYIEPQDATTLLLGQADLLIIDEAAAIPLPLVKTFLSIPGVLVFLASTIHGYEGTGRALSLKLLSQLRTQAAAGHRPHTSLSLHEPIRYKVGDPTEQWLNDLLCLSCNDTLSPLSHRTPAPAPHPDACRLFWVNRDTLFSGHRDAEAFLSAMMALFVSSHYKNSPNDLQLLSDAPAHHLFVLLPPLTATDSLPDILCAIQIVLEGRIGRAAVQQSLGRGIRAAGDLIPWTLTQAFQDPAFAELSGARIIRIATHPERQRMGYGRKAIQELDAFFRGSYITPTSALPPKLNRPKVEKITTLGNDDQNKDQKMHKKDQGNNQKMHESNQKGSLEEGPEVAAGLPPLLCTLPELLPPPGLTYLGVSFGMTPGLLHFWQHSLAFKPVYLRQTPNDLTGEFTAILLKSLQWKDGKKSDRLITDNGLDSSSDAPSWLTAYHVDFCKRFTHLLGFAFRSLPLHLALDILLGKRGTQSVSENESTLTRSTSDSATFASTVRAYFSPYDLTRLAAYADNRVDHHLILDLVPLLALLYFGGAATSSATSFHSSLISAVTLSALQQSILLAIGLQHKSIDALQLELKLETANQLLAIFAKIIKKFSTYFDSLLKAECTTMLESRITEATTATLTESQSTTSSYSSSVSGSNSIAPSTYASLPISTPSAPSLKSTEIPSVISLKKENASSSEPVYKKLKAKYASEQAAKLDKHMSRKK